MGLKLGQVNTDAVTNTEIHTKQNALATILYLINNGELEQQVEPLYSRVFHDYFSDYFLDEKQEVQHYVDLKNTVTPPEFVALADEISDYYLNRVVQRRLSDSYISEWESETGRALVRARENCVLEDDIKRMVKLQRFYNCAKRMTEFSKYYESIDMNTMPGESMDLTVEVRPVGRAYLPQSRNGLYYLFTDKAGYLYGLQVYTTSQITLTALSAICENPNISFVIEGFAKAQIDTIIPEFGFWEIASSSSIQNVVFTNTVSPVTDIYIDNQPFR